MKDYLTAYEISHILGNIGLGARSLKRFNDPQNIRNSLKYLAGTKRIDRTYLFKKNDVWNYFVKHDEIVKALKEQKVLSVDEIPDRFLWPREGADGSHQNGKRIPDEENGVWE